MIELTRDEIKIIKDLLQSIQKDYAVSYLAGKGGRDALKKFNRIKTILEMIEKKER